jgi:pyruvate ferredoxin oxidoreductase gamma subunit
MKGKLTMFIEIRWHGRGGQGVVTASQLLAEAALIEGKHVQAFPEFGPERTGAPILGFTRISDKPIDIHSYVYNPDIVAVIDPTLLKTVRVLEGIKDLGSLIVNSDMKPEDLKKQLNANNVKVYTVNATRIAIDILGRPIYNTAMLGALIAISKATTLSSINQVIQRRFPGIVGENNVEVIKKAYYEVRSA